MLTHLILTIISDDKPGVVEAIAKTVSSAKGNWLDSRMAKLGGKFAGVVHIAIRPDDESALVEALSSLAAQGINIVCDPSESSEAQQKAAQEASFHAVGPDRPGIVKEISQAFAEGDINLVSLETSLSSMPYSGEPLFEAQGSLALPSNVDLAALQDTLDDIADALAMDISVKTEA